ncbi:hypothetical protein HMPREF0201_01558 [Cedecea davisae DSM 4568]|uniref:Uncharacterized protein n=1 Tax=Cedecea davisae DSM 4568 TaxID=566551 RepID=S3JDB8_9ENTR|nr:hypothetical protein HMPREF0201_01558 [Cedecea davisae DSM 4568]
MHTKREKTWFFPLCDYLVKINKLIFLVCLSRSLVGHLSSQLCQRSSGRRKPPFFVLKAST